MNLTQVTSKLAQLISVDNPEQRQEKTISKLSPIIVLERTYFLHYYKWLKWAINNKLEPKADFFGRISNKNQKWVALVLEKFNYNISPVDMRKLVSGMNIGSKVVEACKKGFEAVFGTVRANYDETALEVETAMKDQATKNELSWLSYLVKSSKKEEAQMAEIIEKRIRKFLDSKERVDAHTAKFLFVQDTTKLKVHLKTIAETRKRTLLLVDVRISDTKDTIYSIPSDSNITSEEQVACKVT